MFHNDHQLLAHSVFVFGEAEFAIRHFSNEYGTGGELESRMGRVHHRFPSLHGRTHRLDSTTAWTNHRFAYLLCVWSQYIFCNSPTAAPCRLEFGQWGANSVGHQLITSSIVARVYWIRCFWKNFSKLLQLSIFASMHGLFLKRWKLISDG